MRGTILILIFCTYLWGTPSHAQRVLFPVDLHPGVKNEVAVIVLQKFLKAERFYDGPILGLYDSTTAKAVQKFQEKNAISPSDGVFRGTTRARANSIIQKQLESYTTQTPASVSKTPQLKTITTTPQKTVKSKAPQNCFVAGNMIKHGEKKTMYRYPAAVTGGICHGEKRLCTNGFLDGDPGYRYTACKGTVEVSKATSAATQKNASPSIMCITAKDTTDRDVQLCATLPVDGRCSTVEYPCAFVGPDGKKACFAKVDNACPKVPRTK